MRAAESSLLRPRAEDPLTASDPARAASAPPGREGYFDSIFLAIIV
jgi:hypothetical protein